MTGKCYYEFGSFRLEPGERRLWRHDHRVDFPAKAFDLLLVLVENSGSQISKGELISKVWPGTFVSAGNLTVNMSSLRTALGDHDEKYIENVRGYGYRFKGPVTVVKVEDEVTKEAQADYVKAHFVVEDEVIETEPFEGDPKGAPQENPPSGGVLPPQDAREPGTELALPPANASPSLSPALASQPRPAITFDTVTLPASPAWFGRQNRWKLLSVIALSIAAIFGIAWYVGRRKRQDLDLRQLTTNPAQVPLAAAAISPDGKYVAYAHAEEIWVQAVQTGEMQFIAVHGDRRVYHLAWFPDSINILVSTQDPQTDGSAIWKVSTLASTWRELGDESGEAAVSPDGTRIAYVSENGKEVWLEGSEGEEEKRVLAGGEEDSFHDLVWGPNGRRILFARVHVGAYLTAVSIESLDLQNGRITTVIPGDPGVRGMCAAPDGRIIYSLAEPPPNQNTINLWEIRFDYRSSRVVSRPRRITNWPGSCIYSLSVTADGKCLVFLKGPYEANVYVGDLDGGGTRVQQLRRLTFDDADDLPTAWTPDSEAVLYHSDRNGKWQIFMQRIDQLDAQLSASDQGDDKGARLTPDGQAILYFSRPRYMIWKLLAPTRLMWTPLRGGRSKLVLSQTGIYSERCSRAPATLCVLGERGLKNHQIVFYVLDPVRGKGPELTRIHVDLPLDQDYWDVSPDGSRIAVALGGESDGHIKIISIPGGQAHDLTVKGRSGFQSMDWSADGKGLYVSSRVAWGADLLYIDMQGHATVLRQQVGSFETWGVPSPDGKHLAILKWTGAGKVWMLKGF